MKRIFGTLTVLLITVIVNAQTLLTVTGKVTDEKNQPLPDATITLQLNGRTFTSVTNENGNYELNKVPANHSGTLTAQYVSKKTFEQQVYISPTTTIFNISLLDAAYFIQPLEVTAVRASDRAPFSKTNVSKEEIAKRNYGQDLPFILSQTPSVVVNSDAGNGVGYTGIRIRGTDATRINVTLNGIPYNDAESQQTYFVDLPDFASSVNSIQIQRGVGTSTNGAGAFGATINLSTNEFNEKAYAESNNSYGSFNTWKNTVKVGSGLIDDHFTVDARLSRLTSDGYIDRASSDLQSLYFSTAYINNKTSLRLNIFSGKEKTYQAWYGVAENMLPVNRKFNPAGDERPGSPYNNQTDNYQQDHYQLFFNQSINNNFSFNLATFLTRGRGYYEEYKGNASLVNYGLNNIITGDDTITSTDLVRQLWLDNYFYGQIFSLQYKKNKDELTFGGSWTKYDGKHYGNIIWANVGIPKDYEYYRFPAAKTDQNIYAKWLHEINNKWNFFGDLQYRRVKHNMEGFKDHPDLFVKRNFNFINPKAGVSYLYNGWNAYLSYALANKEPNRNDFEAAQNEQPKKEVLHDFEAGVSKKAANYNVGITLYYMLYKDQLVLSGKINNVGSYTRTNVPNSYRAGIELQGGYVFTKWLNANANLSLSRNKIKDFTEYIDNYDDGSQQTVQHHNTDISFSPSVIGSGVVNILPQKNIELNLMSKYVGRQYLDNTQDTRRSLHNYFLQDARVAYNIHRVLFKEWNISAAVYNIFNKKYEPNGYTFSYIYGGAFTTENYYYPMAGTNYMIGINVKL